MAAAISLSLIPATSASATKVVPCAVGSVKLQDGNFRSYCFGEKGTIAFDVHRVTLFETGSNTVRLAWVDGAGRAYSQVFGPYYGRASKLYENGSFTPLYERVYQIWIL